jgi:hypothetical protein
MNSNPDSKSTWAPVKAPRTTSITDEDDTIDRLVGAFVNSNHDSNAVSDEDDIIDSSVSVTVNKRNNSDNNGNSNKRFKCDEQSDLSRSSSLSAWSERDWETSSVMSSELSVEHFCDSHGMRYNRGGLVSTLEEAYGDDCLFSFEENDDLDSF